MTLTDHPAAALALLTLIVTLGYIGVCAAWPFGPCHRCHGTGKLRAPLSSRAYRLCPRCTGTGHRLRTARRAYNHLRRLTTSTRH